MKCILTSSMVVLSFVFVFGQESIKTCNRHTLHTINHSYLFNKIGEEHPITYNPAKYKKGEKGIKKYFDQNPLESEVMGNELVVILYYAFKVDCHGQAQEFSLINNVSVDAMPLAEAVIYRLEAMPNHWFPATSRSKEVDSYQVIEFTFVQGSLQGLHLN